MNKYTILVVDDDVYISNLISELLVQNGYNVLKAYSGTEALLVLGQNEADLILLDLMLPGICGEDLLAMIKQYTTIVVSAKTCTSDKVDLLLRGASDYITKPFDNNELLARIKVQLRNASSSNKSILNFGNLTMNTLIHEVSVSGITVHLTKTEYLILYNLINNCNQILSKSKIMDLICQDYEDCSDGALKMHISNLRAKLRNIDGHNYIESVWGVGFKLNEI